MIKARKHNDGMTEYNRNFISQCEVSRGMAETTHFYLKVPMFGMFPGLYYTHPSGAIKDMDGDWVRSLEKAQLGMLYRSRDVSIYKHVETFEKELKKIIEDNI